MVDLSVLNAGHDIALAGGISAGGCNHNRSGDCDCECSCMWSCTCNIFCDQASTSIDESIHMRDSVFVSVSDDEHVSDREAILAAAAT